MEYRLRHPSHIPCSVLYWNHCIPSLHPSLFVRVSKQLLLCLTARSHSFLSSHLSDSGDLECYSDDSSPVAGKIKVTDCPPKKISGGHLSPLCCNYFHLSRTPIGRHVLYVISSIPYTYRLFCTVRNFIYPVHLSAVLVCSNFIYPVHLSAVIYCRTYWAQGFVFQHPCFHELMTTTDRFPLMCYVAPTVRLSQGTRMQDPPRQEMWKMEG